MPPGENFLKVKEYAALIRVSASTIYRNPAKYHMFKVGSCWRANSESMKKFAEESVADNNVFRLAVVGGKEKRKCRSTNGETRTGLIFRSQTARELDALLAPEKKKRPSNYTTN